MKKSAKFTPFKAGDNRKAGNDVAQAPRMAWRVSEFCVAFKISNSTFWKYVSLGKIRTIRIGGRVLIPATEADRILSGHE